MGVTSQAVSPVKIELDLREIQKFAVTIAEGLELIIHSVSKRDFSLEKEYIAVVNHKNHLYEVGKWDSPERVEREFPEILEKLRARQYAVALDYEGEFSFRWI